MLGQRQSSRAGSHTINSGWLAILLWFLLWFGLVAGGIYAAIHFTLKYW